MTDRKLPIGIDSFEKLRQQGFYYVDKTGLIQELLSNWGEVNLFTRPRRFGKTLNMSMFQSFFEIGTDPALFEGLSIARETELCAQHMGKYPVVFVSLKNVDGLTFAEAYDKMGNAIQREARRLQHLCDSDKLTGLDKRAMNSLFGEKLDEATLTNALFIFTELLSKHYGQKTILLIDEYDVPLDKAYQHGYYDEMLSLIRAMFGAALKTNDNLHFGVLTGCLRVSKESIFTGLNNPLVHSITDVRYDEYFGFTDAEVQKILSDYDLLDHADEVREWYDGYRFGEQDVYCPWDVINHCYALLASRDAQPQTYWLNTSGNDMVRRLIDKAKTGTAQMEIERLIEGESIYKTINQQLTHNEIDKDIENLWSLLFMTGYLTTKGKPRGNTYELVLPNREVREIYTQQVRAWFKDKVAAETGALTDLYAAFETGDAEAIQRMLNGQLLDTISFYDAQESFYHGFLLALLSTCAEWYVTSNAETGRGRSDILVERKDRKRGFVVEAKDVKSESKLKTASEAAIRQIEDRDYTAILRRYRVQEIWMYGIAFSGKECAVLAKRVEG
jgi:hypothetical protein